MKSGSDNHLSSAVLDIINDLVAKGIKVLLYDVSLAESDDYPFELLQDLGDFTERADIVVANRVEDEIALSANKIFTRDIYHNN